MIQIYSKGNTQFEMNGDMVLFPESCCVTAELNGAWKLDMVHPRDQDGRWRYIEEECIISAPTFMGERQLFRIREIEKTDDEVTVTALPVFLDSEDDCFLMDVRPTNKNGQEALNIMTAGSRYSGQSNITSVSTAYFVERSLSDAIIGSGDPTFIGRWGGEILYDNYKVIINEHVGGDYGVEARYGKNMEGIEYTLDMTGVVTRIVPMAYNGHKMSGSTPWVDSPNIDKYEKKYIRKFKFDDVKMREDVQEDEEEGSIIICDTQEELDQALSAKCRKLFGEGLDTPVISITINMVELSRTDEYKEYKTLETVSLGDDVTCRHKELEIATKERVIEITWDCIRNQVEKLKLGEETYNYFSSTNLSIDNIDSILGVIGEAIGSDGSIIAEKVRGFLDATKTQLRLQNSVAKKQAVRAILFEDLDPDSELYGAMSLGTQGLQIAKKRTEDNRDWEWSTALTANGLIANIIVAGILSDKRGLNYWNLDTGEFALSATGFKIDGKDVKDFFQDSWTQEDVLNKLTNDGADNGIYLLNGKLYISFSAARGGKIILGGANNTNGEFEVLDSSGGNIGSWDNSGFQTKGKYFAVDEMGSMISLKPVVAGDLRMAVSIGSTLSTYAADRLKATVMRVGARTSTTGSSGEYTLSIGDIDNFDDNAWRVRAISIYANKGITISGATSISGNLTVGSSYTKSKEALTENYGSRLLYCYEMPSPMFGDAGEGETDENGECYIDIGDIFSETIAAEIEYQVFLQKEGKGDVWIAEKTPQYFLVKGTENLKFSWEIKAKQKGFEFERLEQFDDKPTDDNVVNYEVEYMMEIERLINENEELLNETA